MHAIGTWVILGHSSLKKAATQEARRHSEQIQSEPFTEFTVGKRPMNFDYGELSSVIDLLVHI